jgi:hypothetical protein
VDRLAEALRELTASARFRERSAAASARIRSSDGLARAVRTLVRDVRVGRPFVAPR